MKEKKIQIMGHESLPSSSSDLTPLLSAAPTIHFTPGVPTEDGWYVVKKQNSKDGHKYYETVYISAGKIITRECDHLDTILSHAKLPEL